MRAIACLLYVHVCNICMYIKICPFCCDLCFNIFSIVRYSQKGPAEDWLLEGTCLSAGGDQNVFDRETPKDLMIIENISFHPKVNQTAATQLIQKLCVGTSVWQSEWMKYSSTSTELKAISYIKSSNTESKVKSNFKPKVTCTSIKSHIKNIVMSFFANINVMDLLNHLRVFG